MGSVEQYDACLNEYALTRSLRNRDYDNLVQSARHFVDAKRERDRLRPPKFSIFRALGCTHSEDAHSSLLAHFLDPCGDHNQDILFLRSFLELVQEAANTQQKCLTIALPEDSSGWLCHKEVILESSGRADIVVWGKNFLAVIENKIFAGDQEGQLARYWGYLQNVPNISDESKVVIYLTPDGRGPTERSVQNNCSLGQHLVLLSYRTDLSQLFHKIALRFQENGSAISVSEVLLQYAILIRRLI